MELSNKGMQQVFKQWQGKNHPSYKLIEERDDEWAICLDKEKDTLAFIKLVSIEEGDSFISEKELRSLMLSDFEPFMTSWLSTLVGDLPVCMCRFDVFEVRVFNNGANAMIRYVENAGN